MPGVQLGGRCPECDSVADAVRVARTTLSLRVRGPPQSRGDSAGRAPSPISEAGTRSPPRSAHNLLTPRQRLPITRPGPRVANGRRPVKQGASRASNPDSSSSGLRVPVPRQRRTAGGEALFSLFDGQNWSLDGRFWRVGRHNEHRIAHLRISTSLFAGEGIVYGHHIALLLIQSPSMAILRPFLVDTRPILAIHQPLIAMQPPLLAPHRLLSATLLQLVAIHYPL